MASIDDTISSASAHLDDKHVGDIEGAFGTIRRADVGKRRSVWNRLLTFLAIVGPGLIVMVGDNDAGAFGTYTQAGQNYGTSLLWTLSFLVPVLYVNQEMVLRLGAVTGVGHARLIIERFGRFWGAFSIIDLFILNALTIVTEFIGISLGLDFFGIPKVWGVLASAAFVLVAAVQGNFRRFERFCLVLCAGSFCLVPVIVAVHPPLAAVAHDLIVPGIPKGANLSTALLLVAAIVGTTVAPWQLFFQQSYVIDKRITPRFITYERWDLALGILVVVLGAAAMIALAASTFAGRAEFGAFSDAGAVARGIATYIGYWPGAFFAVALIDSAILGAAAVSLSTAYALGDVVALKHSLHRKASDAPLFYGAYAFLIAGAAALVLIPGTPLGLLTNAVQVLAGVLLPSATVFLLLLCNDKAILGPWVNGTAVNTFTGMVIALLIALSVILTAATLVPTFGTVQILWTLGLGIACSALVGLWLAFANRRNPDDSHSNREQKLAWRMPPLATLPASGLSRLNQVWLAMLRVYLLAAIVLVAYRVTMIALHRA